MASGERILESIEEEMAGHGTPQAITITIVEPSAWRPEPAGLHTTTYDSTALVTSVQAQDAVGQDTSTLVVVPGEGGGHRRRINVSHGAKGSIQTVSADGHITTQELPIISSVCSNEDETSQHSTIQVSNKIEPSDTHGILSVEGEVIEESEEIDDSEDTIGHHCLVCNVELPIHANDEAVPLFKTDTTATQRKMAVYLGILVGRKLTSGRVHSDTICRRCFSLLDRVDSLEVEIKETKEEIVNKYLDTQAAYGGRAQRRKTVAPKQSDYVYPKVVEPEDEVDEVLKLEMDDNFEPSMDDLIEEEQDQQEDHNTQDEEWEPEFRRPRVKREAPDLDPSGQPKRKRGRPRKDASRPKGGLKATSVLVATNLLEPQSENVSKAEEVRDDVGSSVRCEETSVGSDRETDPTVCSVSSHSKSHMMGTSALSSNKMNSCKHSESSMSSPLNTEEARSAKVHCCSICNRSFRDRSNMNKHKKLHSDVRPHVCEICGNAFRQKHSLKEHLAKHETDHIGFACKFCHVKFSGKQQLVTHENQHVSICEVCGMTCENKRAMDDHMSKHTGRYKHNCSVCKKGFNKLEALVDHGNIHTGSRPYVCLTCGKRFANTGTFWQHKTLHKIERKYACAICKKAFKLSNNLKAHLKTHGTDRKHVCDNCGQSFLKKHHLVRHSRLHTGEKPYICEICGQTFPRNDRLREHQLKDHKLLGVSNNHNSFTFPCLKS